MTKGTFCNIWEIVMTSISLGSDMLVAKYFLKLSEDVESIKAVIKQSQTRLVMVNDAVLSNWRENLPGAA